MAGGNTPGGNGVPAITRVADDENDWLFHVTPGKYYGHPNPQQHHYVLNAGNPGSRHDSSVIPIYPLGTQPDPQWEPPAFDFGPHVSADGIIEYRGNAVGGKLDRKLIVCRFNVGSDLIVLGLDPQGAVNNVQTPVAGPDQVVGVADAGGVDCQRRVGGEGVVTAADVFRADVDWLARINLVRVEAEDRRAQQVLGAHAPVGIGRA